MLVVVHCPNHAIMLCNNALSTHVRLSKCAVLSDMGSTSVKGHTSIRGCTSVKGRTSIGGRTSVSGRTSPGALPYRPVIFVWM